MNLDRPSQVRHKNLRFSTTSFGGNVFGAVMGYILLLGFIVKLVHIAVMGFKLEMVHMIRLGFKGSLVHIYFVGFNHLMVHISFFIEQNTPGLVQPNIDRRSCHIDFVTQPFLL